MVWRWAVPLAALAAAACGGSPSHGDGGAIPRPPVAAVAPHDGGLTPRTARVALLRTRRTEILGPAKAARVLVLVLEALRHAGPLTPYQGGPRLLVNLRLNEHLVVITLGVPQSLTVGRRRVPGVSQVMIPFTGSWRKRILVVREGRVEASRPLLAELSLVDLEWIVEKEGGQP